MTDVTKAMEFLGQRLQERNHHHHSIPYDEFLKLTASQPYKVLRNVFQLFHDMIKTYVGEGVNEYPDDPESIGYLYYDCARLFVEKADHPFFADRIFANRLINHVDALKSGAQQNKIYVFDGPPGCGKSTFLNNLLRKFEEYANTEEGLRYEILWRLDSSLLSRFTNFEANHFVERINLLMGGSDAAAEKAINTHDLINARKFREKQSSPNGFPQPFESYIEIPCPSHDHPILMIPKASRRSFLELLFEGRDFADILFTEKDYDWIFSDTACTICTTMYQALLEKLDDPMSIYNMIYVRPYLFNRRLGEGISVFNPGDMPIKQPVLSNDIIQGRIDVIFDGGTRIDYKFSKYARTNNGIYALMDIKSHNTERLIELHNIVTEGVHKVDHIEENVNSLFLAVMNPEDRENIKSFQSFSDRIQYINIPYVLDLKTEVEIYRNVFGKHIDDMFLPRVLHNFARVVISTRLKWKSDLMLEWIKEPSKYQRYCDDNLLLLKIDLYTGYIPPWLSEEDVNNFTADIRKRLIIKEASEEGKTGLSGRDAIKLFNDFYATYAREDQKINMAMLNTYFTKTRRDLGAMIPSGFLDSLIRMYNYQVLQEVKESLYYYNEEQINRDIQNYLFALNFEIGSVETSRFTGDRLEITEDYLTSIENRLLGASVSYEKRNNFRRATQKEYSSQTLTQEMMVEDKKIVETKLFNNLHEKYVYNLKQKVLDPFLDNENFRRAIVDYGGDEFKTYDKRIKDDVAFLISNLETKYRYTAKSAKDVCMYVIDNDLAKEYSDS